MVLNISFNDLEIAQLFGIYFGQDKDLFTEIDLNKPMIPQLIASYKQDCSPENLERVVQELKELISLNYSEEKLKDEVFPEIGAPINTAYFGLGYQEFLIEVLRILKEPSPV